MKKEQSSAHRARRFNCYHHQNRHYRFHSRRELYLTNPIEILLVGIVGFYLVVGIGIMIVNTQ